MSLPFNFPRPDVANHPGLHFIARLQVRTKLSIAFSLVLATVLLALWLIMQNQLSVAARKQSEEVGTLLANQSAESVTELVLTNDLLSLNVVLNQLVSPRTVTYAAVYNVDRQLIAEAGDQVSQTYPEAMRFAAPIDLQDSIAGVLELTLMNTAFEEQTRNLGLLFLGLFIAGLLFILVTALALTGHLLNPLNRFLRACDNPLDAELLPDSVRRDEMRAVEEAGMDLIGSLQHHLRLEAWRAENSLAWRKRHVDISVLALEVVNFENSLSMLNPSTMTRLLNTCYQLLEQAAELYQGAFFRFTGKTVLVAFDRQVCASPEFNAVCCGALFQHLVTTHNTRQVALATPVLEFRTLVHSGPALVTRTGQQDNSSLALIGDTVESALFSVRLCPGGELSITDEARREAVEEYNLGFRSLNTHTGEDSGEDNDSPHGQNLLVITTALADIDPLLADQAEAMMSEKVTGKISGTESES